MYSFRAVDRVGTAADWNRRMREYLEIMGAHHGILKKTCCGIDFRLSSPFIRRDVGQSTMVVECRNAADTLCGFAILKTQLPSDCVYIVLICSIRPGVGRALIAELVSMSTQSQRYLVARSTDQALGFYLRFGFRLFNWQATDGYLTIGEDAITRWLQIQVDKKASRQSVRDELCRRRWIDENDLEWPMILVRRIEPRSDVRRSCRLRSMSEACTLRD